MGQLYVVIRHESVFERIHEVDVAETVIGRDDDCALWLPDLCVSRNHALLLKRGTDFVIRDLGSRNGTLLHGRLIRGDAMLHDGAEVQIGPYRLTAHFDVGKAIRDAVNTDDSTASASFPVVRNANGNSHAQRLTPAQQRVYEAFVEGLSEKEVAARLGITFHTVHDHAKAIYKTLGVSSRSELISRWATHLVRRT